MNDSADRISVPLSEVEFQRLNDKYPEGNGSGLIGQRAEEIVAMHLAKVRPGCKIEFPRSGADILVTEAGGNAERIEVKGTRSPDISWGQLKVSSAASFKALSEGSVSVYRVCSVFDRTPSIFVLRCGEHFRLEPEPRWAMKPVRRQAPRFAAGESQKPRRAMSGRASKYDPLQSFLTRLRRNEVTVRFADFAETVGVTLPRSALEHQAYWANQTDTKIRPWARAWQAAGYAVSEVKLGQDGWVQFRRVRNEP